MTSELGFTLFSNFNVLWLVLALAGGAFGAMIGGNYAFGFTGVTVLLGVGVLAATGSSVIIDYVAFGPVFGPHIAFAGGAAAAAYAARKGALSAGGKDVSASLAGLNRPDVLLVGALFGGGAYVVEQLIALIPWFGTRTDVVALTVVISGVVARMAFGKTPVVDRQARPSDTSCWLRYQEKPGQLLTIGGFVSLLAAGITLIVGHYAVTLGGLADAPALAEYAHVLPFGLSAICIFFVAGGRQFPVTHHMTLTAGIAAMRFYQISGDVFIGVLVGVVFGVLAAFLGEFAARRMYYRGDTHIDPPAAAIWAMNTAIHLVAMPF